MGRIQVMSDNLANKIAAGEVVERPSSVVKELVENAIDAGSTKIEINLEASGIQAIKVTDNGSGMDRNDALLAFSRHATSKLISESDLFRISSLGFRGEALPSIASVSDITLVTSNGNDAGTKVNFRGGKLMGQESTSSRRGTEITVKSLFFNTPARLKYLKAENTELSYTIDFINKIAISNPHIAFKLINNDRLLLETYGNNNIIQVLSSIYGLEVAKKIEIIEYKDNLFSLNLYLTTPEVNRTTRNYITVIINKRMIKNNELLKSVLEGYESYLPIKRYPIVVLDIRVDPLLVDVNVHPSKLEVRLSNQEHIKTVITDLIQKKLRELMYVPKISLKENISDNSLVKEFQESFDFTKASSFDETNEDNSFSETIFTDNNSIESNNKVEDKLDEKIDLSDSKLDEIVKIQEKTINDIPKDINYIEKSNQKLPKLYYIGQLLGTYLLAQNENGLFLIDQHAAQERINYEYYLRHFSKPITEYYDLLIPLTLDFSQNEALIIEDNLDKIESLHIDVEKFGLASFIVRRIPNYFRKGNETEILKDIFNLILQNKKLNYRDLFKELAITLSCKRSIKANHYINEKEINQLLVDLEKCDNPYTCPHGRPVVIHMSVSKIEHLFKRTM